MNALTLIILAAFFNGIFGIFVSRAAGKIDANLAPLIFNSLAAIVPLFLYWFVVAAKPSEILPTKTSGIMFSVLAGISIAIFSVLIVRIFARGENLSYVFPIIYGVTVVISTVGGLLLFGEKVTLLQSAGIISIVVGLVLVSVSKI